MARTQRHKNPPATGRDQSAGVTNHADREWDRFLNVAVPTRGGGWRDPAEPAIKRGVTCEEWNSLVAAATQLRHRRKVNHDG